MVGVKGHVEIAGAGLSGLAAAAAFARGGWSVRVHERSDQLREIGAGIFMWENGLRVLEAIGAFDEAMSGGERDEYWEIRDERQRLLQSGWMMGGTRLYTVLRSTLHQALAHAAMKAGAEIMVSSRVTGATPDGELLIEGGEKRRADLVIGADGVNSVVRDSLRAFEKYRRFAGWLRSLSDPPPSRRSCEEIAGVLARRPSYRRRSGEPRSSLYLSVLSGRGH